MADIPDNIDALTIVVYPDPRLRQVAAAVANPTDPQVARLVARMRHLMGGADGVGIAATQLGVSVRIFLANATREPGQEQVFINPEIVETEGWQETEEGCLSLPGLTLRLRRRERVRLRYQDLTGAAFDVDAKGFLATIFQHEGDHLDGKLIIDRASLLGRLSARDAIKRLEADYESAQAAAK